MLQNIAAPICVSESTSDFRDANSDMPMDGADLHAHTLQMAARVSPPLLAETRTAAAPLARLRGTMRPQKHHAQHGKLRSNHDGWCLLRGGSAVVGATPGPPTAGTLPAPAAPAAPTPAAPSPFAPATPLDAAAAS